MRYVDLSAGGYSSGKEIPSERTKPPAAPDDHRLTVKASFILETARRTIQEWWPTLN
jgi:hypothetical protein